MAESTESAGSTVDWAFFSVIDYVNHADETERAPDAAVWDHFVDRLREAVSRVVTSPTTTGAADRASAFHGLLQNMHFIIERALGSSDPYRPVLSTVVDSRLRLGCRQSRRGLPHGRTPR